MGSAILTVTNMQSLQLNERILRKLSKGIVTVTGSTQATEDPEDSLPQNIEDLEKVTPSGMPQHTLNSKRGAPV